ncbi:hypothetical protein [Arthrobacter sp. A5]|uniref:hypothetical protein n=1 Tax=Arthrobacter sp. A5 TaxID=576926 RepID=UPI003DAA129E
MQMVDRVRELVLDLSQGLGNPFGGLVFDGLVHRPASERISHGEREGVLAFSRVSAVRDGIDGDQPQDS